MILPINSEIAHKGDRNDDLVERGNSARNYAENNLTPQIANQMITEMSYLFYILPSKDTMDININLDDCYHLEIVKPSIYGMVIKPSLKGKIWKGL